ncbi:hypothetical protein EJ02DRAFT_40675 [Clathrospora elynae]|uniref:Uncharacterized protein n=1 Tax=Clathrospora elynae TaxID=706981 RepID=A0A6A5SE27_9PLEO|nr:hypothetical protein EJ02DRAFT_40675 [Clathrospora elynae]
MIPAYHWIFGVEVAPVSERHGFPIMVHRILGSVKHWEEVLSATCMYNYVNQPGTFLHLGCDPNTTDVMFGTITAVDLHRGRGRTTSAPSSSHASIRSLCFRSMSRLLPTNAKTTSPSSSRRQTRTGAASQTRFQAWAMTTC